MTPRELLEAKAKAKIELNRRDLARDCRLSFYRFIQEFWSVVIREAPQYNWHVKYLADEMQAVVERIARREKKESDIVVNISPGSTKTTIFNIFLPVWCWVVDPTLRLITNSYSHDIALESSLKSRDILQSDKFKWLFPNIKLQRGKENKSFYANTETGSRFAVSTGSAVTGEHCHLCISDDPLNPAQAYSPVQRKTAIEHTKTLSSRLVDPNVTVTITIGQRLHEEDVTQFLLDNEGQNIKHICLPAELSDMVKPAELKEYYQDGLFNPIRLSREILQKQKIRLGSMRYACEYEQRPSPAGGNIVQRSWFQFIHPTDFANLRRNEPIHFFLDTAFTANADNDPTGLIATCKIGNNMYILNAEKVYKTFPDLIRFIPEYVARYGYDHRSTIRIEPKANGLSVIDQLKEITKLNVVATPSPKDSKETRLHSASPKIESGRVFLVVGNWNEDFIHEVCAFPSAAHDEFPDLVSYSCDFHLKEGPKPVNAAQIIRDFS